MMLSEAVAAAIFGLISSIGQLGGLAGNYMIGYLNDRIADSQTNNQAACHHINYCDDRETGRKRMGSIVRQNSGRL